MRIIAELSEAIKHFKLH